MGPPEESVFSGTSRIVGTLGGSGVGWTLLFLGWWYRPNLPTVESCQVRKKGRSGRLVSDHRSDGSLTSQTGGADPWCPSLPEGSSPERVGGVSSRETL